ncbi:MAG: hypothetical protein ABSG49_08750 [Methanoregula sp.]|uniref:hypothetical protein n=1 Tax=Methanoregula sp. TaxID=2052170 RepID=UPI003C13E3E8
MGYRIPLHGKAAGVTMINSIRNNGRFIGPSLVGFLLQTTGTTRAGLVAIGPCQETVISPSKESTVTLRYFYKGYEEIPF